MALNPCKGLFQYIMTILLLHCWALWQCSFISEVYKLLTCYLSLCVIVSVSLPLDDWTALLMYHIGTRIFLFILVHSIILTLTLYWSIVPLVLITLYYILFSHPFRVHHCTVGHILVKSSSIWLILGHSYVILQSLFQYYMICLWPVSALVNFWSYCQSESSR